MFTGKYRAIWKAWVCQSFHVERTCLFSVGVWLHPFSSMLHGASWMVLTGEITKSTEQKLSSPLLDRNCVYSNVLLYLIWMQMCPLYHATSRNVLQDFS